jgi:class 3 adenylate cyclase
MSETRKIAAILVSDVVGYSRLAGADEDRTLARLRALRSDLIDPTISVHHGRIVKRTGDGSVIEFRSVVDAVRCALEVGSIRMTLSLSFLSPALVKAAIEGRLSRGFGVKRLMDLPMA